MKTVQESMRSMSKRYSIVVVIIVISVLSITTSFIVMTQKQQHTTFAQLQGQESLNFSIEQAAMQEFPVPLGWAKVLRHMGLLSDQMALHGLQMEV